MASAAQRSAFIDAWLRHGNVRRAMRETGVGSPTTAYRWIHAFERHGSVTALEHAASRHSRIAPNVGAEVVAMREANPT